MFPLAVKKTHSYTQMNRSVTTPKHGVWVLSFGYWGSSWSLKQQNHAWVFKWMHFWQDLLKRLTPSFPFWRVPWLWIRIVPLHLFRLEKNRWLQSLGRNAKRLHNNLKQNVSAISLFHFFIFSCYTVSSHQQWSTMSLLRLKSRVWWKNLGFFFLRLKFQVAESCQVTLQSCGFFGGSPRRNRDLKGR